MADIGDDFYETSDKKFALIMVMDVSGSMRNEIGNLERKFNEFVDKSKNDDDVRSTMDMAVITFGSDVKDEFDGFCDTASIPRLNLELRGSTNMSEALELANNMARERTRQYKKNQITAYTPWIILMTDGYPDCQSAVATIGETLKQREADKKVHVVAVGMGDGYNRDVLLGLTDRCFGLDDWNFDEFFSWLGKSVANVSQTNPDSLEEVFDDGVECQNMRGKFFDDDE